MQSEPTLLERKLIARVRDGGKIAFRDFMRAALYDAKLGYYNTERLKIGPKGDYFTSSNVHAAFGAVMAKAIVELWEGFDGNHPLTIVEMGAGTGQLASDMLCALRDDHPLTFKGLRYLIVESSAAMISRQRERLTAFKDQAAWLALDELEREPVTGIFFSNELIDAMPVARARLSGGKIEEQYVELNAEGDRLALLWGEPCDSKPEAYIEREGISLIEGQVIEINLDAVDWLESVSRALVRGFLITVDYGDIAAHLYGPDRAGGTLRSFYRHTLIDSPLERVGEQDITASVNFTALIERGRDFGFETLSYERQVSFLIRNGLIEKIAATASQFRSDLKERLAIKNLFVPGGASDNFRVLIQRKT